MRTSIMLVLALVLSVFSNAQVLPDGMAIKESPKFEIPKKFDFNGIIGEDNNGYVGYAYNQEEDKLIVYRFTQDLTISNEKQIDVADFGKTAELESVLWFQNAVNILYSTFDEGQKETTLHTVSFSASAFEKETEKELTIVNDEKFSSRAGFRSLVSNDNSKLGVVVSYTTGNEGIQKLINYNFICFDEKYNELWASNKPEVSAEGELGGPVQMVLTNTGSFVFSLLTIEINQETIDDIMDYIKRYIVVVDGESSFHKHELRKENMQFGEMVFDIREDGNINFVSTYYDKEEEKLGYHFLVLNQKLEVQLEKQSDFGYPNGVVVSSSPRSNAFVQKVLDEFNSLDPSLNFHELSSTDNGSTLVGEVSFKSYYAKSNSNYLGAFVTTFNEQGEVVYEVGVPKIQLSKDGSQYGSIGTFNQQSKVGLVTNNLPGKQIGGNFDQRVYEGKKATSLFVTMVDDGDFRTTELLELKAPFYGPQYFYTNKSNNVIFYGNRGTEYGFLEIKIE